jgi:methylenetetrahydrofolate dehydrogenase (NADP+)/methenyltetrahydrofolate cyclohydrolase
MTRILKGSTVSKLIMEKTRKDIEVLHAIGVMPVLCIIRVGDNPDDVSYENGAVKKAISLGIGVQKKVLDKNASQEEIIRVIETANRDDSIHGIMVFRPLPNHIDDAAVRNALDPRKDVDGISDKSLAGVFTGSNVGYPPCTAQACIEILDNTGIEVSGKRAVVAGRSLVVGKPAAMMLLKRNATVTICHTKTDDMPSVCREADILIVAVGKAGLIGRDYINKGQTVIDVGINSAPDGTLCGDVRYDEALGIAGAITPVPGGVGAVTTAVLMKHVVDAALRMSKRN